MLSSDEMFEYVPPLKRHVLKIYCSNVFPSMPRSVSKFFFWRLAATFMYVYIYIYIYIYICFFS